jgi:hypothetical protein
MGTLDELLKDVYKIIINLTPITCIIEFLKVLKKWGNRIYHFLDKLQKGIEI